MRLLECLRVRVKDIDCGMNQVIVRAGKGHKARLTLLPTSVKELLAVHLQRVRELHQRDLSQGCGRVYLPDALPRQYPNADRAWGWHWVFPASQIRVDPRSGEQRRQHLHESVLQKAVSAAARQGVVSNRWAATLCAMPSLPLCSKTALTSARFRNCSATGR